MGAYGSYHTRLYHIILYDHEMRRYCRCNTSPLYPKPAVEGCLGVSGLRVQSSGLM